MKISNIPFLILIALTLLHCKTSTVEEEKLILAQQISNALILDLKEKNKEVQDSWEDVKDIYQSRINIVSKFLVFLKKEMKSKKYGLTDLIKAKNKATSINLDVNNLTPENMAKFEETQSQLTEKIVKLLESLERYPELKATNAFRDFQTQHEGIQIRIAKARRNYNETILSYNIKIKTYPKDIKNDQFTFKTKAHLSERFGTKNSLNEIDLGFEK